MLGKPDLADDDFETRLRHGYGIQVTGLEFLPPGSDAGPGRTFGTQSGHGCFDRTR